MPGMSRFARKLDRRAERRAHDEIPEGSTAWLAVVAGGSLGFNDKQISDAMNTLSSGGERDELADMLETRLLELLFLLGKTTTAVVDEARSQIEGRRGAGFFARVEAMGGSAREIADRIRYRNANFSPLRGLTYTEGLHGVWSWVESSGSSARCARRSTSRRRFLIGCARARESSRARVARSRSFSFGAAGAFASGTSRTATRISRSFATTGRLSARRTRATEGHPGIFPG